MVAQTARKDLRLFEQGTQRAFERTKPAQFIPLETCQRLSQTGRSASWVSYLKILYNY
jgi:hypothetical protein